jgi:hypothetical protein
MKTYPQGKVNHLCNSFVENYSDGLGTPFQQFFRRAKKQVFSETILMIA